MSCGSTIVRSTYDYDEQRIGPYVVPVKFNYVPINGTENTISEYRMYEELLASDSALAVFNLNNLCICVLYEDRLVQRSISKDKEEDGLMQWVFQNPIVVPKLKHVGFIATYQDCFAVTVAPYHLTVNMLGTLSDGFGKLEFNALENPPYSLYKELVKNNADAVLFDVDAQKPVFLNKK